MRRETKRIREEKEKSFAFVLLCRKMTRERRRGDKDADKDVPPTRTTSNTRSVRRVPLQLSDVVGVRRGSEGRVGEREGGVRRCRLFLNNNKDSSVSCVSVRMETIAP